MPLLLSKTARPNILFIMSDDHGYQALSCYGSRVNQTPNLDRIAKEGMRFDRCFVTNSICGPSRATILTGKYSHLNGFVRNGNEFYGGQQHVGKLLRQGRVPDGDRRQVAFEERANGFRLLSRAEGTRAVLQSGHADRRRRCAARGIHHRHHHRRGARLAAKQRDSDKPFFLMCQHKAPHRNWQPGPKYLNKYDGVTIPEPDTLFDDYAGRGSAAKQQKMTIAKDMNEHDLKLARQRAELTDEQRAAV